MLAVGVALRAWQLLYNSPLWLDELALTNGILAGPFPAMFTDYSDFAQSAPPAFVVVEWVLVQVFPRSDVVLRLPAFLFACAALVATWAAAREIFGERDAWVPTGLVALSGQLVYMAGQVKPYAADAFFTPLIIAIAMRHDRDGTAGSWRSLFAAGVLGSLFSFGAVFVWAGAAAFLLARGTWRKSSTPYFGTIAGWAAAGFFTVIFAHRLLSPPANAMMVEYWGPFYPTLPPSSIAEATWPAAQLLALLWELMGLREVWLFGLMVLAGAVILLRQRPTTGLLVVTPVLAMYGAAYVRQFPVHERLLHWTVPILALLLGVVANRLAGWLMPRAGRVSTLVPGALILATPALSIVEMPPPYVRDNVAPALTRLAEAAQPGDMLFLNFGMWHSWQRYGSRVPVAFHELIVGGCPKDYPRGYLRELEPLRGNPRVWLLFARVADRPSHEVRMRYLDSIGIRAEELQAPARGTSESSQVDLYRYDFSDSTRLRSASAESFPIPAGLVEVREGCRANVDAMYRRADGTRVVTVF